MTNFKCLDSFRRLTIAAGIGLITASAYAQPYGLTSRPAIGPFLDNQMPEAAPVISGNWSAVVAFTNLMFTNALGIAAVPGTTKLVVWEREGRVYALDNTPGASSKTLVLDISNQCQGWDDSGLLNLVFHPGLATNRYMFVYYTWVTPGTVVGSPTQRPTEYVPGKYHDRLSRFTLDANGVAIASSELVLVDQTGDSVWHNGGGMFFHPVNGFLYWTDGDDERAPTQIINQNLFFGVFRIDVDMRGGNISHPIPRQPAKGATANYYIPNDNPFVGQSGVLEEFYALGLRSPHRMTCDPPSGRIFIGDVGAGSREEIDLIEPTDPPGLNFQWSRIEGLGGDLTPPYIGVNKRPIIDYTHSEGQAVIGGYVYRGSQFAADLGGKYIFGDNVQKKIWVLNESTSPPGKILLCIMPSGAGPNSGSDYTGLSSFGLDQDNELYLCQMSSGGRIYKLARAGPPPASRPFPPLLSQTGAFQDSSTLTPGGSLIPYTVNSPLWSDGAVKQRWLALPTNTFVHFGATGEWTFPGGTVFVKNFELLVDDTNPGVLRRLETRLLVRDTNGAAYGITYKWRPDNSDADLLTNSLTEDIVIQTATGTRTQQWFYPSREDCLRSHTPAAGYVLGLKTRQLNGNFAYPGAGVTDNPAPLEHRVRSYLDANCAQCHRPGGAPALWDARFDTPLASQGIVSGPVADPLGISGAKVVAPQDLSRSIMYQRVNSLDAHKMPPLARNTIDANAVAALAEWINSLPPPTNGLPNPWLSDDIGSVGFAGDAAYSSGSFTVSGGGDDIWNNADAFHYVHRTLNGDGEIIARVVSLQNTDPWAKAGVMIRETLTAGSRHAFALISSGNGAAFQRRVTTGGASAHTGGPSVTAPYWVRLTRTGNVFRGYASANGASWTLIDTITNSMGGDVFAGLAVTAHNNGALNTSVFADVSGTFAPNQPPIVNLVFPTNNTTFIQPNAIMLVAAASDPDGTVSKVEFLSGTNLLGTVTNAPYNLTWLGVALTNYTLTARATDNLGAIATSSAVNVLVLPLNLTVVSGEQTDGQFRLWFRAQDNQSYLVETSTDLTNWVPALTNTAVNGRFDFLDVNATDSHRFYRARQ